LFEGTAFSCHYPCPPGKRPISNHYTTSTLHHNFQPDKNHKHIQKFRNINSHASLSSIFQTNNHDISVSQAKQLKQIALTKAEQGQWKASLNILERISHNLRNLFPFTIQHFTLLELADTLHHLGVAQNKLGRTEEALESFTESLSLRQQLRSDSFSAAPTILAIAKITLKETEGDMECQIYKLLMSQLADHRNSKTCPRIVSHILRQFECALELLNPKALDPM